ncbi:MAG TPA: hypothetical protein VGI14_01675 [Casimicrobiaceae bacterium]
MRALLLVCVLCCAMAAAATPYVPADDATVLERLPEKSDAALRELKALRAALVAKPDDLDAAVRFARRAVEASRERGDPRFLGQAQAALAPWWNAASPPDVVRVLRATVRQSLHDFDGALADLDALLAAHPGNGQALLTRATVLTVRGRYADALRDCAQLARRTTPLVFAACSAAPASSSGSANAAYLALREALVDPREQPVVREWALTLAAEIAARRGDAAAAEAQFRAARALDARDPYLKAAYADFLLDQARPRDALALVADDAYNDALLLRVALAEASIPERHAELAAHRDELAARFDAAHLRGDSLHRREEARFRLALLHDANGALELARQNWSVQREPADLRLLVEAARAAGDRATFDAAREWATSNRLDDVAVRALLEARP